MKYLFFFLGSTWLLTAFGSFFLGSFIGIDGKKTRSELIDLWKDKNQSMVRRTAARFLIVVGLCGYLFPLIYPIPGFLLAVVFLSMS